MVWFPPIEHGIAVDGYSLPTDRFAIDDAADWAEVDVGVKSCARTSSFAAHIPICQEFLEVVDVIEIFDDEDGVSSHQIIYSVNAPECFCPDSGD